MIGYHDQSSPFAKEAIPLSEDFEQVIAEKIRTLSKK